MEDWGLRRGSPVRAQQSLMPGSHPWSYPLQGKANASSTFRLNWWTITIWDKFPPCKHIPQACPNRTLAWLSLADRWEDTAPECQNPISHTRLDSLHYLYQKVRCLSILSVCQRWLSWRCDRYLCSNFRRSKCFQRSLVQYCWISLEPPVRGAASRLYRLIPRNSL